MGLSVFVSNSFGESNSDVGGDSPMEGSVRSIKELLWSQSILPRASPHTFARIGVTLFSHHLFTFLFSLVLHDFFFPETFDESSRLKCFYTCVHTWTHIWMLHITRHKEKVLWVKFSRDSPTGEDIWDNCFSITLSFSWAHLG